jgi:hypothetical protein
MSRVRTLAVPVAVVLACLSACTAEAGTDAPEDVAVPEPGTPAPPDLLPDDDTVPATDPPRPAPADGVDVVDVVVSLAEWDPATADVLVGGYVSPVVEDGGTCTVELEQDGRVVRNEAPGTPDATTTVCGGLDVDGAELGPGTWTLVLRYESPSVSGESAPVEVEVAA